MTTKEPVALDAEALEAAFRVNHHPEAEPSSVELKQLSASIRSYLEAAPAVREDEAVAWLVRFDEDQPASIIETDPRSFWPKAIPLYTRPASPTPAPEVVGLDECEGEITDPVDRIAAVEALQEIVKRCHHIKCRSAALNDVCKIAKTALQSKPTSLGSPPKQETK